MLKTVNGEKMSSNCRQCSVRLEQQNWPYYCCIFTFISISNSICISSFIFFQSRSFGCDAFFPIDVNLLIRSSDLFRSTTFFVGAYTLKFLLLGFYSECSIENMFFSALFIVIVTCLLLWRDTRKPHLFPPGEIDAQH